MAVNNLNFSATIDAWVRKSEARMLAVFRESSKLVVRKAQARIPVDTGFARASIMGSTSEMPRIDPSKSRPKDAANVPYDEGPIVLTINGAAIADTIYIGWTANYVAELERGHSKQAPNGFVRLAALEWQTIVSQVVAEAKSRVG